MPKTKVINFKFDEKIINLIDELQDDLHLTSRAAVVRRSLVLMRLVIEAENNGKRLYFKGPDNQLEKIVFV
ncbi:MAG: hypothetical protein COB12_12025 [Flavobacterium sp.]|nr:MAG: hypothetical protein COB12_12025 [Flavobacterium sp.]